MKENKLTHLLTSEITIPREARQRKDLSPDSILELCHSIAKKQTLLHPIAVERESKTIIAGERRLTAFKLLEQAVKGDYSAFSDPASARELLSPIVACTIPLLEDWTKIPAQLFYNITPLEMSILEFVENRHRKDLSWQDTAKAAYQIHCELCNTSKERWTDKMTAQELSMSAATFSQLISTFRAVEHSSTQTKEKLETIVKEAPSAKAALLAIERVVTRHAPKQNLVLSSSPRELAKTAHVESLRAPEPEPKQPTAPILNEDFTSWAPTYSGPTFNFIHCDFPYGILYNKGAGQATSIDNAMNGDYDDSPDVYWKLLSTLLSSREYILDETAHIMFWFAQQHRRETEDQIKKAWPDAIIQPYLMIWHCSDNSGLLPDPQRFGRRNYETAMLITLGDRKIAKAKSLSFSFPRNSQAKIHRSQKHIEVLTHFFEMFVDTSSFVLDPTCGSASSLVAARNLKAKHTLGLEIDEDMVLEATKLYGA